MLSGVASIKAQQSRMNVISDNLANVNTTAFKGSRVSFQEMMAQTISGGTGPGTNVGGTNPLQYGMGVTVGSTDVNHAQGSLEATNRPTDLAIEGNGFFMVSNGERTAYTRDGGFTLDSRGDLVQRNSGERVVGWTANALGEIDKTAAPTAGINIPLGSLTATQATTNVSMTGNLDSAAAATETWTQTVRVYDSTGASHDLTVKFSNRTSPVTGGPTDAASSWDWEVSEAGTVLGNSAGTGNAPIYFNASGKNIAPTALSTVTLGTTAISMNFNNVSSVAADSQVVLKDQNGYAPGSLESISIGKDGKISGIFTNGMTKTLAQVATAVFTNPGGLERIGGNLYRTTTNSGVANVGAPNENGHGSVSSGYLESSNVDMSQEFTDLIVTQRGFQANTKIVNTVDEMLQELMQLKR